MYSVPRLLQGVFPFSGRGLTNAYPVSNELHYTVPIGKRAQLIYFRGGNSADELIYVVLMRDSKPLRFFPIGAKSDVHVPLAVVEDLAAGCQIEAFLAAPENVGGSVVLDIGLVEI